MALAVKHAKVSGIADSGDATLVQPTDWNASHALTATDGKLLGASGSSTVGEITVSTGLDLTAGVLTSTVTQYTDEQAQDAVGTILVDSSTIDFTYSDPTPSITAIVIDDSITNAKLANMATQTFKGRTTVGTSDPEDLSIAQAKTMLSLTGTNSGDQTITLTGDVTGSGTSSFAATIANDAVTYAKMQNVSAASRVLGRGDGGSGDTQELTPGSNLSIIGTAINAVVPNKAGIVIFDDFHTFVGVNGGATDNLAISFSGAAATVTSGPADANHPGVISLATGTTTTGRSAVTTDTAVFLFGGGAWTFEALINIEDLSTVAEEFDIRIGFGDTLTGDMVDGAYFEYDRNSNTNWNIVTASNSSRTRQDSGVAVPVDTWTTLKIDVNASGTSVAFSIDGVATTNSPLVATIPTGAGRQFGCGIYLVKSAGSTSRSVYADYVSVKNVLTTPRT